MPSNVGRLLSFDGERSPNGCCNLLNSHIFEQAVGIVAIAISCRISISRLYIDNINLHDGKAAILLFKKMERTTRPGDVSTIFSTFSEADFAS